jgi:excisionase family DNA binding protein
MTPHLYSIEQVAELLNLHVKTVRRYVQDGRLKAKRIGKQYRITRPDLEAFAGAAEHSLERPAVARTRHVVVSAVVDADAVSPAVSDRIGTLLIAGLNARRGQGDFPRVDCIYYPEHARLRITITATPLLTSDLLKTINALLED